MCGHQYRGTLFLQLGHHLEHLAHQHGVERRGDLVQKQQLGVAHQRAADGDALLLTAGKAVRVLAGLLVHADALQEGHGLLLRVRAAPLEHLARGERHVVEDGHVREEVELLKHHANALAAVVLVDAGVRNVGLAEPDLAVVHALQHVDALHERGLARAGRPQKRNDLVLVHVERDVVEHHVVAKALHHVVDAQDLLRRATLGGRGSLVCDVWH